MKPLQIVRVWRGGPRHPPETASETGICIDINLYINPVILQVKEQFNSYDENKDGRISREEMEIGMTINKVGMMSN